MTDTASCIERLREHIERSDRAELPDAQAAIIQFALAAPDQKSRAEAMGVLQAELSLAMGSIELEPIQAAYYAVVDAMIDRTRDAVLGIKPKAEGG